MSRKNRAKGKNGGNPFIIWYPVFKSMHQRDTAGLAGLQGYEILWDEKSKTGKENMSGAGMLLGNIPPVILEGMAPDLKVLAGSLTGEFRIRSAGHTD